MIRRIKDEDVYGVLNIFNYYVRATEYTLETEEVKKEDYLKRIHDITTFYPWIVYEENGKVLGFAYLDKFNYRKAYQTTADLTIYVTPDTRGKGIGRELYQTIEKMALSLGICKIVALITSINDVSIEFHKAMGYNYLTTINNVAYKHGKWVGVVFMEKDIQTILVPQMKDN